MSALVASAFVLLSGAVPVASAASPIPVYIFAGQSNMVGAGTVSSQLPTVDLQLSRPQTNVQFWGPTTDAPSRWGPLKAPTEVLQAISRHGFGPEVAAAPRLAALHPGTQIAIFKFARNATNLYTQWSAGRRQLYPRLIDNVKYALTRLRLQTGRPTKIAGIFWMQGESDAGAYKHASAYGANLTKFIAAIRRDLRQPNASFVIGQIDDVRKYEPRLKYSRMIMAAQWSVAKHVRNVHIVSTKGLAHSPISPIHYGTRGTVDLGKRFVRPSFGL